MKRLIVVEDLVCAIDGVSIIRTFWSMLIALSNVCRRCLIPIVWAFLTVILINLPQSQEFFDGFLKVCGESEKNVGKYMA